MKLPRWNNRRCGWIGGDAETLFAFTDPATGQITIRPGRGGVGIVTYQSPLVTVRVATRSEAETLWQAPLHPLWKVVE